MFGNRSGSRGVFDGGDRFALLACEVLQVFQGRDHVLYYLHFVDEGVAEVMS